MEVAGSYTVNAPVSQVWEVLMNPSVLADCLPGIETLEAQSEDEYVAKLNVGVGPIRGRYDARILLRDIDPYSSYRLVLEGSGSLGFANGEALVTLTEHDGSTVLDIQGEAQIGGTVARVGQRMVGSVAKGILDRFIECVQRYV